jgi:uncharacterized membrane-anchored protein YjiN (DUF445 family)
VAAVVFVVTRLLEARWPWLGYLRATAEASMVGGLADWFAVTALFRHPLGIPIPHTAIIPARKDRIGRSLGNFVQNNFLAREVIASRLDNLRLGERAARWLAEPEHARKVARSVARGLARGAQTLRDEEVSAMIDTALVSRVRKAQVAPLVGNVLTLLTAEDRHQELLDEVLRLAARAVAQNEEMIRERIRAESPWWLPETVDDKIHDKIVSGIERTLADVSDNPEHPLRHRFDEALARFIENLKTSPEVARRAENIRDEMLAHPAVRQFSGAIWGDLKDSLVRYAEKHEDAEAGPNAVEQGLVTLGNAVLADPELLAKVDRWVVDTIIGVVEQYRGEVSQLIAQTVGAWDPHATSEKIELQIGRDLQFVRINGTLVGGLVGLLLYVASKFVG